jgi:DNA-binding transcriptional LysR family regulator
VVPGKRSQGEWADAMDLRHLQTFCVVIDTGGFTRAAERLFLAQSAVSQQIRQLEEALGTVLFERSALGVRPTQSGEVLYQHARRLLAQAEEARGEITALEHAQQGRVAVAVTEIGALVLTEMIGSFGINHSDVAIAVFEGPVGEVLGRVRAGQADFGLAAMIGDAEQLTLETLVSLELIAVCRPEHALAHQDFVSARDLAEHSLAVYDVGSTCRQIVERACASVGSRPRVAFESNWETSILRAVEAGLGVAVLPRVAVREQLAARTVVARPLSGVDDCIPVRLLHRPHQVLDGPARALIAALRDQVVASAATP